MAEGLLPSIFGLVRGINDRKKAARLQDAEANVFNDPSETNLGALAQIDAPTAFAQRKAGTDEAAALRATKRSEGVADLGVIGKFFRNLEPGADVGAAIDEATPFLTSQLGVDANGIQNFKTAIAANPRLIEGLDDDAFKEITKGRFDTKIATPGSYAMRDGKVIAKVPFGMKTVSTKGGDGQVRVDSFDPNTGEYMPSTFKAPGEPAATPFTGKVDVDTLLPHVVAQESSDNYKSVNKETGALGRYQVMPQTGRGLAAQLGLAWRPDMMKKDDPASRRYQDAIGRAAIQESVNFGGGDPARTFSHYYGGPDERKWGPKTRKYTEEMMARLSGGDAASAGGPAITMPGKTPKPGKSYRAATREEIKQAGYPDGTAAQVDQDGKMVNLKTPTSAAQKALSGQADRARDLIDRTTAMVKEVTRLRQHPGLEQSQGVVRGHLPDWLTGQEGTNFRNAIRALRSNIGLDRLLEFKAGSAQGASGFGNLSNAEGDKLEKKFGNLAETNDPVEMRRIMDEILTDAAAILRRQYTGFKTMKAAAPAASSPAAPAGVTVTKW